MARPSPYTPEQKTAILEAVKAARKTGTWPDALKAAEGAGYKGGMQYLMKFADSSKRGATKTPKAAGPKKGPGRPKGSTNAAKRGLVRPKGKLGRPKGTTAGKGAGLSDIDRIVAQMVEQRLGVALAKAVSALEDAAQELKSL